MDDRSRSTSATDFAVQLNCLSDSEQYNNKSSYFTNNMNPPILLPFHTPYEVGLSNIYFKEDFISYEQMMKNLVFRLFFIY